MSKQYWNEEIETMSPDKLRRLEAERLQRQISYVYNSSPWYKNRFDKAGIRPETIKDHTDLARVPFTEKRWLSQSQDDGSLVGINQCAPQEKIIRIVGTGGSTGRPLRLAWTQKDLITYTEQGARALWAMGCRPNDVVINCFNYSIYAGGVLGQASFERLGATVIPYSVGQTIQLFEMMNHLKPELSLYATPSYAIHMIDRATENNIDLHSLRVRKGFLSGEAGLQTPGYRERIESNWGMKARDLYGAAEVGAHSAECEHLNGLHWFGSGLVIAELINPESGELLAIENESIGELVFTSLEREAGPLIRLRTHDLVQTFTDPCPCGRTGFRFRMLGRGDDMFIVKGVNVFPLGIQRILTDFNAQLSGEYRILLNAPPPITYEPIIEVEVNRGLPTTAYATISAELRKAIREKLSFTADIRLIKQGTIASQHKTRRVYRVYDGIVPPTQENL